MKLWALGLSLKAGASLTDDELREWLKDRVVHFKIPSCVRFVDQFPLTVTGKIQKYVMRAHMIKELGLENGGRDSNRIKACVQTFCFGPRTCLENELQPLSVSDLVARINCACAC